jgi:NDP-sugar pyrophosphorylase family protein
MSKRMEHSFEFSKSYRQLTEQEIGRLKEGNCYSEDWTQIHITGHFDASRYHNTRFSGTVYIGDQADHIILFGGVKKNCGIYNVHIHNCIIGDNVYINHIKNYIANYTIEDHVIIDNVDICAVDGLCSFGNGIKVQVLDETGGRKVVIYDKLSAHLAYIMAFYKHRNKAVQALEEMIEAYTKRVSFDRGVIGRHSQIFNCRKIINVRIGPYTFIDGASMLENGSLNSNQDAPVKISHDAILKNFIISSGSEISDGAIVANCFVGQGCVLGSQYSAQQSLFFANCQGFHGEACSVFAGPYTVTHHKSTLLIAGMFSFCNAGSGSNQSNHMYKLGPIHHGIVERGSKTTSDSYLLWPAKIGAFTLVMGRHYKNSDTSNMPFSYLVENNDESWLAPGINLKSVGTIRDVMKWPRRDRRTDPCKTDHINFNLLSPFTIQKMSNAIRLLQQIRNISGETTEVFSYNNTKIKSTALKRGLELYHHAIMKFIGNSVITRLNQCPLTSPEKVVWCLTPKSTIGQGDWIDLAGLFAPKTEVGKLLTAIEETNITQLEQVEEFFSNLHDQYYEYEWNWTAHFIEVYLKKQIWTFTIDELIELVRNWRESVIEIDRMLYEDAKKEFRMSAMTGFGIDGDQQIKQQDFEQVRGRFEDNDFVTEICNHIERKKNLGNRVIQQLREAQKLPLL